MAFCSNCGNQLEGSERFCGKCGSDVSAKAAGQVAASQVAAGPRAAASVPMQAVQPMGAMPGVYAQPGAIPVAVAIPQQAPAKKGITLGTVILVAALAAGGYYYFTKYKPAVDAQKQKGANAALAKQQAFDAHWQTVGGFIQLTNGKWTNNANVAIQSATLECDQYDASGNNLDQMRTTLNGPVNPGGTDTFNPFNMGAVANNLNKVTCTIMYVKQAGAAN
ncbi:MAG: zinc-ribbon domain-containing protein [Terracidiphilus sp.]